MDTYEFSTQITTTGSVEIPIEYVQQIPQGASVRVRIVVDKIKGELNETNGQNGHVGKLDSLEELIAEIKQTPIDPAHIHPASGKLAEHLANPVTTPDTDFDATAWDREWAEIEAKMKAASLAHEQEEIQNWPR